MTTASQAYSALRTRLSGGGLGVPLRWQGEDADSNGAVELPDDPATFVYSEMIAEAGELIGYGGGIGQNLYRNPARFISYVFVPKGDGLTIATDMAEQIAALFRSYRDANVLCIDATVHPGGDASQITPPGLNNQANLYFWAACEVSLSYDQIG